jgi:hypothetical protein
MNLVLLDQIGVNSSIGYNDVDDRFIIASISISMINFLMYVESRMAPQETQLFLGTMMWGVLLVLADV